MPEVCFRLTCNDARLLQGDWTLSLSETGRTLLDSQGSVRASWPPQEQRIILALRAPQEGASELGIRFANGEVVWFRRNKEDLATLCEAPLPATGSEQGWFSVKVIGRKGFWGDS
jgi:hypothetical protein